MTSRVFSMLTAAGAEWVMYLLAVLSVLSVALILERLVYFQRFGGTSAQDLVPLLALGRLEEARLEVAGRAGLEATVALAALDAAAGGPRAVEEMMAAVIARERPGYERFLSFLGTLGNNAPFLGLFGTVVGIIKAFSDLSVGGVKAAGAAVVMAGISEALVATAIGILVAIPAVVAFNGFNRRLRTIVNRTESIGHALMSHLEKDEVRAGAYAAARVEAQLGRRSGAKPPPFPDA